MDRYDEWKLSSGQEGKTVCYCDRCDGEIIDGEQVYKLRATNEILHYDCWDLDYATESLDVWLVEAKEEIK